MAGIPKVIIGIIICIQQQELHPWAEKVDQIKRQTKILRIYFNNHYGGNAVLNALQFKTITGHSLSDS